MKIVAHHGSLPDTIEEVVSKLRNSRYIGLQQRCYEFLEIATMPPIMKRVLPLDGCCEEIDVDESLSFLDTIVEDALSKGAKPYEKKEVRLGGAEDGNLRTEAYKTQRADVVDEDDLMLKSSNRKQRKLIIKDGTVGAKNLTRKLRGQGRGMIPDAADANHERGSGAHDSSAGSCTWDPLVMEPRKPTKNESSMTSSVTVPSRKKKGDRAKESRRCGEAEAATKDLTTENAEPIGGCAAAASCRAEQLVVVGGGCQGRRIFRSSWLPTYFVPYR